MHTEIPMDTSTADANKYSKVPRSPPRSCYRHKFPAVRQRGQAAARRNKGQRQSRTLGTTIGTEAVGLILQHISENGLMAIILLPRLLPLEPGRHFRGKTTLFSLPTDAKLKLSLATRVLNVSIVCAERKPTTQANFFLSPAWAAPT